MKILVFNPGSASLRFEMIAAQKETAPEAQRKLVSGIIENISAEPILSILEGKQKIHQEKIAAKDYAEATFAILSGLSTGKWQNTTTKEIEAVGHRIVHGGEYFDSSVVIDDDVLEKIELLNEIAPLHNARAGAVIRAARQKLGRKLPAVAVFDTVFHRTIPPLAAAYPINAELAERYRIRRYGFHGISHEYLTRRYAAIAGTPLEKVNIITLHLENGCSVCAVHGGKSVDTSMGLTPLEGLMMGKRSGDIDPSIVGYLARKEKVAVEIVEEWLNQESGLLGVSGRSNDTRELVPLIEKDERVCLALEMFCYRLRKYIGAYLAVLGGAAQAIVLGGGISENTPFVREQILKHFTWCGLKFDSKRNERVIDCEGRITTDDSSIRAFVIPVEEGLMIAHNTMRLLENEEGC
jgi:acetate kinase